MKAVSVLMLVLAVSGCAQFSRPPVLTSVQEIDRRVGEVVTLRGEVSNTKVPTLLGVDVESVHPDLRGKEAEATGVLYREAVTAESLSHQGKAPHRGPGVFYFLRALDSEGLAQVRPALP